ncbi:MAG: SGNH/GDSL hydrolase family protein [Prolixibacteraceae bacterium]|jgi:lysophospholipase L1-like esterase|nr:SGNH/GDSL hydrolase family protein [Prolixibacteraceae bacterium]
MALIDKNSLFTFCIVFLSFLSTSGEEPSLKYVRGEKLTLSGQAGTVSTSHFQRIDSLNRTGLTDAVKTLSSHSAGLNILFQTNSRTIGVKWKVKKFNIKPNMTPTAINGLDLYGWNAHSWQFVAFAGPDSSANTALMVQNLDGNMRHYRVYLPLYSELTEIEIGVEEQSVIQPADPEYFPSDKVVIYGSSITQGASASRPGMAYPSIISRNLNVETFNLGFSGSGKMEIEVVDVLAKIPADLYVLDCVPNTSPELIKERALPFIKKLRMLKPGVPILIVESIFRESGHWNREIGDRVRRQNESIKKVYEQLRAENYPQLYYIASDELTGTDHEVTIDGTHLNDLGMMRIAQRIGHEILKILQLPDNIKH